MTSAPVLWGSALQVVGLGLAAYGVRETRIAYAPEIPGIEGRARAAWKWSRRRGFRAWLWVERTILRRTRSVTVHGGAAVSNLGFGTSEAYGEVSYGELDATRTVEERLAELDGRTRANRDAVNAVSRAQREDRRSIKAVEKQLVETDTALRAHVAEQVRSLAVGGLTRQAIGLLLTAVGTVVIALGS